MDTAPTWDSFRITLETVLDILRPVRCFEWGPGKSTDIMSQYTTVKSVDSVEHNPKWLFYNNLINPYKVNLIFEPNTVKYPIVTGRFDEYDLIFVDGIERESCLKNAKSIMNNRCAVILHDAERPEYQNDIRRYKYKFWCDDGHTVVLVENSDVSLELKVLLRGKVDVRA